MLRPAMQRVHRDTRQENARLAARFVTALRASLATARALKTTKRGVAASRARCARGPAPQARRVREKPQVSLAHSSWPDLGHRPNLNRRGAPELLPPLCVGKSEPTPPRHAKGRSSGARARGARGGAKVSRGPAARRQVGTHAFRGPPSDRWRAGLAGRGPVPRRGLAGVRRRRVSRGARTLASLTQLARQDIGGAGARRERRDRPAVL